MKQLTINLLTWREAELYCKRVFAETKIVPIALNEGDDQNIYYTVLVLNTYNKWVPAPNIKPEEVRE